MSRKEKVSNEQVAEIFNGQTIKGKAKGGKIIIQNKHGKLVAEINNPEALKK